MTVNVQMTRGAEDRALAGSSCKAKGNRVRAKPLPQGPALTNTPSGAHAERLAQPSSSANALFAPDFTTTPAVVAQTCATEQSHNDTIELAQQHPPRIRAPLGFKSCGASQQPGP